MAENSKEPWESSSSKDSHLELVVPSTSTKPAGVQYDILGHLKRLSARASIYDALQLIYDALQLSQEAREVFITALTDENI
ncbi:hypothetical protein ACLOJK_022870 [Asimina triloba]